MGAGEGGVDKHVEEEAVDRSATAGSVAAKADDCDEATVASRLIAAEAELERLRTVNASQAAELEQLRGFAQLEHRPPIPPI